MRHTSKALNTVLLWGGALLFLTASSARTATLTGRESAEVFFLTLADQFLRQQFAFGVTNIPVAPTNAYSPALHRLLQVAANIYDATRSEPWPSVFRPLFTSNVNGVFVTGYTNDNARSTLPQWLTANRQYGIPLVIGAKKGYPNFNEYTLRTDMQVTRKLEFVRAATNLPPYQTNQMFVLGLSNLFGVEAWNSYSNTFGSDMALEVSDVATVRLTNQDGVIGPPLFFSYGINTNPAPWGGQQFVLPLLAQEVFLPPSVYRFQTRAFDPVGTNVYERTGRFPLPHWHLSISNQLLYVLSVGGKIVDFMLCDQFSSDVDLDQVLMSSTRAMGAMSMESGVVADMWDTNRIATNLDAEAVPPHGVIAQIAACLERSYVDDTTWRSYCPDPILGHDKPLAIATCQQFFQFGRQDYPSLPIDISRLVLQSPFCPTRKMIKTITWQANDPLVHTHFGDLLRITPDRQMNPSNWFIEAVVPPTSPIPTNMTLGTLGRLNGGYAPWGGNPEKNVPMAPTDPEAYNLALKDPQVWTSDQWDFPTGQGPILTALGRVHRGTPWQTLYLKSAVARVDEWMTQSSDYLWAPTNAAQFVRDHPTNDWALVGLAASLLNTNSLDQLISMNDPRPGAWAKVWDGLTVLSNSLSTEELLTVFRPVSSPNSFDTLVMTSNSPPAAVLTDALSRARALQPSRRFNGWVDFFQVPELSLNSPWFGETDDIQRQLAISDAAYEAIPNQLLARLRTQDSAGTISRDSSRLRLHFNLWPGYDYQLQSSTDLVNWSDVTASASVTDLDLLVEVAVDRGALRAFYRLRQTPRGF